MGTRVSIVVESRIVLYSYEEKKWVRLRPLINGSTTGPLNVPPGLCSSYGGRTKPSALVVESVRVEDVVPIELVNASVEFVRAATRAQVDAPARRAPILGRKLVANDLHLFDGIDRRTQSFARRAVIVVVQTVNRDVV